jgi:NAD(P)-dependent dehydrogenase (short-subunit alcohol dehydrogenase family)
MLLAPLLTQLVLVQVVFNNAGVMRWVSLENANEEDLLHCYRVNAMAHIFVVQALLQHNLLKSGSLIANITSLVRTVAARASAGH